MLKLDTPLEIATSTYAAGDLIIASGLAAVATSVGLPKFPIPYPIVEQVRMLAPYGLLGIDDQEEFTRRYIERLDRFGAEKILRVLEKIADREQRRGILLLCFEPDGEFCHRRLAAEWLESQVRALSVPELRANQSS